MKALALIFVALFGLSVFAQPSNSTTANPTTLHAGSQLQAKSDDSNAPSKKKKKKTKTPSKTSSAS